MENERNPLKGGIAKPGNSARTFLSAINISSLNWPLFYTGAFFLALFY
jgi:hypothetical protein